MDAGSPVRGRQDRFLAAYAISMSVARAAKDADIDRHTHYVWLESDPTYKPRFEAAHRSAVDAAVGEAWRRAVEGVPRHKFHNGKPIPDPGKPGQFVIEREYSDRMLELIVTRNDRRFRDRQEVAHTGPNGGPIVTANIITDELREQANQAMSDPKVLEALLTVGAALAKGGAAVADDTGSKPE